MVTKQKLDFSFPNAQFSVERQAPPFRYDHKYDGGSILVIVREEILAKIINTLLSKGFKRSFVELNLRAKKILLCYFYN